MSPGLPARWPTLKELRPALAWSSLLLLAATACALRLAGLWLQEVEAPEAPAATPVVVAAAPAEVPPAPPPAPIRPDPPQPEAPPEPSAGPSLDAPATPKALQAVADELKARRERVERREAEIAARETALAQVEQRLADYAQRLETLRRDLSSLFGKASAEETARVEQQIKLYEAMKPKTAASIFDSMDLALLVPVIRRMRDAKVAGIIDEMTPAKAQALAAELARMPALPRLAAQAGPRS